MDCRMFSGPGLHPRTQWLFPKAGQLKMCPDIGNGPPQSKIAQSEEPAVCTMAGSWDAETLKAEPGAGLRRA